MYVSGMTQTHMTQTLYRRLILFPWEVKAFFVAYIPLTS